MNYVKNFFAWLWFKFTYETAMTLEVVKQVIGGLVIFGLIHPSVEQLAWMNVFVGLFLQYVVRQTSIPTAKVKDAVGIEATKDIVASTGAAGTNFVEPKK